MKTMKVIMNDGTEYECDKIVHGEDTDEDNDGDLVIVGWNLFLYKNDKLVKDYVSLKDVDKIIQL